jgi:hypothetical protein
MYQGVEKLLLDAESPLAMLPNATELVWVGSWLV